MEWAKQNNVIGSNVHRQFGGAKCGLAGMFDTVSLPRTIPLESLHVVDHVCKVSTAHNPPKSQSELCELPRFGPHMPARSNSCLRASRLSSSPLDHE